MAFIYKIESPIFVLLCALCFQRQPFRFLLLRELDTLGRFFAILQGRQVFNILLTFLLTKSLS